MEYSLKTNCQTPQLLFNALTLQQHKASFSSLDKYYLRLLQVLFLTWPTLLRNVKPLERQFHKAFLIVCLPMQKLLHWKMPMALTLIQIGLNWKHKSFHILHSTSLLFTNLYRELTLNGKVAITISLDTN